MKRLHRKNIPSDMEHFPVVKPGGPNNLKSTSLPDEKSELPKDKEDVYKNMQPAPIDDVEEPVVVIEEPVEDPIVAEPAVVEEPVVVVEEPSGENTPDMKPKPKPKAKPEPKGKPAPADSVVERTNGGDMKPKPEPKGKPAPANAVADVAERTNGGDMKPKPEPKGKAGPRNLKYSNHREPRSRPTAKQEDEKVRARIKEIQEEHRVGGRNVNKRLLHHDHHDSKPKPDPKSKPSPPPMLRAGSSGSKPEPKGKPKPGPKEGPFGTMNQRSYSTVDATLDDIYDEVQTFCYDDYVQYCMVPDAMMNLGLMLLPGFPGNNGIDWEEPQTMEFNGEYAAFPGDNGIDWEEPQTMEFNDEYGVPKPKPKPGPDGLISGINVKPAPPSGKPAPRKMQMQEDVATYEVDFVSYEDSYLGFGYNGDNCMYENYDKLTPLCQGAIQDMDTYHEDANSVHWFSLILIGIFIFAIIRFAKYLCFLFFGKNKAERKENINKTLAAIHADPVLKANVEAVSGVKLPTPAKEDNKKGCFKCDGGCKRTSYRIIGKVLVFVAGLIMLHNAACITHHLYNHDDENGEPEGEGEEKPFIIKFLTFIAIFLSQVAVVLSGVVTVKYVYRYFQGSGSRTHTGLTASTGTNGPSQGGGSPSRVATLKQYLIQHNPVSFFTRNTAPAGHYSALSMSDNDEETEMTSTASAPLMTPLLMQQQQHGVQCAVQPQVATVPVPVYLANHPGTYTQPQPLSSVSMI